jgi:hypothetical protein
MRERRQTASDIDPPTAVTPDLRVEAHAVDTDPAAAHRPAISRVAVLASMLLAPRNAPASDDDATGRR